MSGSSVREPGSARQLPRPVRILADDLTGALDTAAMFAASASVPVRLELPLLPDEAPVSVISTGTRDTPTETLAARLAPCLGWLAEAGLSFKKVDSLLRGNALAEVAEAVRGGRYERVVFAPALPAQGRFMVDGRLRLGPPHRPGEAADAPAPGPLVDAFAALGLPAAAGPDAASRTGSGTGARVLIPDIPSDEALDMLVERVLAYPGRTLWCGSAGLAAAMTRFAGRAAVEDQTAHAPAVSSVSSGSPVSSVSPSAAPADSRRPDRPPLLVTGSRHPALRGQLARLRDDPTLGDCRVADLAPAEPLDPAAAAARLAADAARLVETHPNPDRIVVVGGDTLLALCRAARVDSLAAGPPPRPGWGAAVLQGGLWHGARCLSRSGAFGAPDDLVALLRTRFPSPHAPESPPR
jgi:D-threonate/D-erythronate kinase